MSDTSTSVSLTTNRLQITPMHEEELVALQKGCRAADPELAGAYGEMLAGCHTHPEQFLWYTAWKIVLWQTGAFIGDLCFKGLPASGRPEIGYGLLAQYQGKGYATEAVRAICDWALSQNGIAAIEAETAPDNIASQRVLQKLMFEPTGLLGEEGPCFERLRRIQVNGRIYRAHKLIGHGKGGYSYLSTNETGQAVVVKQMHHEPSSYYQFKDKMKSELQAYERLQKIDIPMPKLLNYDKESERLVKQYIPGHTVAEILRQGTMKYSYLEQMQKICSKLYKQGINIDYYPTNFVVNDGKIYYIDYECSEYTPEMDFENWGSRYWR